MLLEINGIKYQGFKNAKVRHSIDECATSLQFTSTSEEISNYPIKNSAQCAVYIGDFRKEVLNGYIDIIEPSYDNSKHDINIQGRGKTSLIIDSSVWDKKTFKAPNNLITIAKKVISDIGADISIINNVGIIQNFKKDINAQPGEKIFDFLERLARKSQVMLTCNGEGNLVFTRAGLVRYDTLLLNEKGNFDNNVLKASMSYNYSNRYGSYRVVGQASPSIETSNESQTNQNGIAYDTGALSSKRLEIVADQEINISQAKELATWEANIRRAKSQVYRCTVQGHEHLEGLWEINSIHRVVDVYNNIDSEMLIKTVEYIEGNDGTFTELELVPPDAYTLEATRPIFDKAVNAIGADFEDDD